MRYVQKYVSKRISLHTLQYRQQATADLGQEGKARSRRALRSDTRAHRCPQVRNGHIKRITDNEIQSLVLEIAGTNVSTTYITCPADPKKTLGIKLPFLVMIIKNLKKYFTFEVQVRPTRLSTRRCIIVRIAFRFWTIATFAVGSERATTNRLRVSNRSSARCPCVWTMAGIKFSSIFLISLDVPTERITSKRCEFKYVAFAARRSSCQNALALDPRQLSYSTRLLLGSALLRGRTAAGIQIISTGRCSPATDEAID